MFDSRETLLDRAVAGDGDALADLLESCGPSIRKRLDGKIAPKYSSLFDVDDVLQVTYLEAFLRIKSFQPRGLRSFQAWLTQIARNNLRDAIRAQNCIKRPPPGRQVPTRSPADSRELLLDELEGGAPTGSSVFRHKEARLHLEQAIEQLPPDYARVVRLCDLELKDASHVAAEMGRSTGAVYMLRSRAHDCLRALLGPRSAFFSRSK